MELTIKLRRDTATTWESVNPILAEGEPGVETDTRRIKIGDGTTAWNSLNYIYSSPSVLLDNGAPTTDTEGVLGQMYIDTTNQEAYICVDVDSETPEYTWKQMTN